MKFENPDGFPRSKVIREDFLEDFSNTVGYIQILRKTSPNK